jgi:hypothetical protein
MLRFFFNLCLSAFICGYPSSVLAAPPALTHLYPAGAQRGTSVDITATGTLDATTKLWASGTGVLVEATKTQGKYKVTVAKDAVPGVYWLRAHNAEGASGLRPFVVGTLPEVMEKEPNDDFKKPHALEGSCVVNGKLEKNGDVDCFAVQLKKGQTLVASLEAHNVLRSPMDGMLQILSSDGFVLEENNDFHGLDPQIAFTAKKDGTYIARVYAFPAQPDASIRYFGSDACIYRLTLTTGAFADFAPPLAVGPDAKEVEAEGWNLTPETKKLTLAPLDDHFATAFGPDVANTVRVRREPHPAHTKIDGPFAPPFCVGRTINRPGDETLFGVNVKKGQVATIQAESRAFGLAVNPVVRVIGPDAKVLSRAEPNKLNNDTALTFTFPNDGAYTIGVSDLYRGFGPRHAFLLRVLTEPDYELTVTTDRFALAPGKPTPVPVKVNRLRGFTKPVEVLAEGMPEGVKVEVTALAKPDPNTITLSLTAERPVSGAFRIVGTVKDEPKLTRTARAPLTEFENTTTELWLAPTTPQPKK